MKNNRTDRKPIAFCGLYCEDCPSHKGKIADLARDLRKELRTSRFDMTAKALSGISFFNVFKNYAQCYEVLGAMVKFRCKRGCKDGGGPPFCRIRICCRKRGIDGCWGCDEFENCKKLNFLKPIHGDAHIKNIRTIGRHGAKKFLMGKKYWYAEEKK